MTEAPTKFKVMTLLERPDLEEVFRPQKDRIWPQFMLNDLYANKLWHNLADVFAAFQIYLLNEADQPIAVGQTLPCTWDGTMAGLPIGWADSFVRGVNDYEAGRPPNTLAALEIAIQPEYRGQGVSYEMLKAMRALAEQQGFQAIIVAVRPSLKSQYPITPMEQYVRWQREDGAPFDPWLRAHWRRGAEILKIAHPSMVIEGSVDDWEQWTKMKFPTSGDYIVPGALVPIHIDRAMNVGRYIEPNVWVHHPITTKPIDPR
ncbi:MAG: GNAT family N-acetyltransferase [Chloroflexota bacterium]